MLLFFYFCVSLVVVNLNILNVRWASSLAISVFNVIGFAFLLIRS